jgi:hypothetical protein
MDHLFVERGYRRYHSSVKRPLSPLLAASAAAVFICMALAHLPLARVLHYATFGFSGDARLPWLLPVIVAGAFLYERLVRGTLYAAARARLTPGLAAPVVAIAGAVLPGAARLFLVKRPPAPFVLASLHAFLVAALLGLGLCWMALAAGSTLPCGAAQAAIWSAKLAVAVNYRGGVVPVMELVGAAAASAGVALVLSRALAPHRDAVIAA